MKYLKKIIFSLRYIILIYIIQYLIVIISSAIYLSLGHQNLEKFITNQCSILLLITYIFSIIILLKQQKYKNKKLSKKLYYPLIHQGISISCLYNTIIYLCTNQIPLKQTIPLYISIISTGIIGPILEEILFRYILLNELKKFNSPKKSILLATIIFAIVHGSLIKIIYAFILGLILNIIYHKRNNIKAPVLVHISANIISIFLTEYNTYILILSLIGFIISTICIKEKKI